MRILVIYNFEIENMCDCDIAIFVGELFRKLSIDAIKNFQQYIDELPCTVIIFYECCLFQIRHDRIYANNSYENFYYDAATAKLKFNGAIMEAGLHEVQPSGCHQIIVENNQLSNLPRLTGTIEFLALNYRDCNIDTLRYIRNMYGRIDTCTNLAAVHSQPQFIHLLSIEWKNICCFCEGRINFDKMDQITIIKGTNGCGKSSLLSIILFGFFGGSSKRLLRKGCDYGEIIASMRFQDSIYTIINKFGHEHSVTVTRDGELIDEYKFMSSVGAAIREKFDCKISNAAIVNDIFGELCGMQIINRNIQSDDEVPVDALSAGQKFMLELAHKLPQQVTPQVLFIDERMDKLDEKFMRRCVEMILKYRQKILIVTHREEVAALGAAVHIKKFRGSSKIHI